MMKCWNLVWFASRNVEPIFYRLTTEVSMIFCSNIILKYCNLIWTCVKLGMVNASYKGITLHQFCPPLSDVSLVCCFLPRTQSARPTQYRGTGYQYSDVGVGGNGEAHWTHPLGAGDRRLASPSQLLFHSWLQLAGQQPDPTFLRADSQWPAGTAGPLCQDPSCQVWPSDCQVRKTGGHIETEVHIVDTNWQIL